MNIVMPVTTTRQPDFVVAITSPEISELLSPYMLGVLDAEKGELCVPEAYYIKQGDMCEYCEGYASVNGPTLTTRQFLGDVDAAIEADDYEEDMLDRMFWARGEW